MPQDDPYRDQQRRLYGAVLGLCAIVLVGGAGYHFLGYGRFYRSPSPVVSDDLSGNDGQ